jgi:hypothetical protein
MVEAWRQPVLFSRDELVAGGWQTVWYWWPEEKRSSACSPRIHQAGLQLFIATGSMTAGGGIV